MYLSLFLIAAMVSSLGTVAGFGGGIFMVPIMVMAFDIPIEIAIGVTALSLVPSSLQTTYWNTRRKTIDFKLVWALMIPTMIGAAIGASLTAKISAQPLEIIFSLFLFFIAWKTISPPGKATLLGRSFSWLNSRPPAISKSPHKVSLWASLSFGGFAGIIAGLFGIGGGILQTPLMINVFYVPVKVATATAICIIALTSASSGLSHWLLGHVSYDLFAAVGGGFFFGAFWGNKLNVRLADHSIKKVIAGSMFLAGLTVFIHSVFLR